MGVKRTQKTASASLQKKAKKISAVSQEDKDNGINPSEIRRRCPKKNYYESDNSWVDDSDADSDYEKPASKKRGYNKRKMNSESDSAEDTDEDLTKPKVQKRKQISMKKKALTTRKKPKSIKASSDPYSSSEESEGSRNESDCFKKYQPLLSSEGSDSDIPIENNRWKHKMGNSLESKLLDKSEIKMEPVTSVKLMIKTNADEDVWGKNECNNIKIDKDILKEEKLSSDSDKEDEGIKMALKKTERDKLVLLEDKEDPKKDKALMKEKKNSKESAATKKSRSRSKTVKREADSVIKETSKRKEAKKPKSKCIKNSATKKQMGTSKVKNLDDVSAVLMQFEGKKSENKMKLASGESLGDAEDSSESDWEEVEDDPSVPSTSSGKPQQAVEITLEQGQCMKQKKKKKTGGFDWKAFFRRQMNVFQRELQITKHKVHLLCLIGHGMVLNKFCRDPVLKALSLSLVSVPDKPDFTVGTIKNILRAFAANVQIKPPEHDNTAPTYFSIVKAFSKSEAESTKEYTMMVVMSLRSLGLKVRLLLSFHPVPLKVPKEGKKKNPTTESKNIKKEKPTVKKSFSELRKVVKKEQQKIKKSKSVKNSENKKIVERKSNKDNDDSPYWKKKRSSRTKSQNISYKESDGSDFEEDKASEKMKPCKKTLASKVSEKMTSSPSSGSSDDFEEEPVNLKKRKQTGPKAGHKIISSSSSEQSFTSNQADEKIETWIEVYLESEKRWLSIDCINMVFDDLSHFENLDSRPLSYVITFDNDGYLKDVTPRYSTQWMLKTRKLRVQEEWWEKTMKVYLNQDEDNKIEDTQIQDKLLKQPLPKAISEYKNHPLYILKRHLLKFEAIYPNSAVPLGYIRNEPVYARECVHQLHARETWMKEGRNVKVGEEPYKMVKSRPKWNKPKENPDVPDLPIFGKWQTEIYVPPPAVDGKIPRNEYGNVELFKPTMLPAGTVHLRESGLNRIARKLGVDCAAAMVGWDFHGGACHPVFDGWVVCVENKDMILEEWAQEQERAQLREIEKREKRVYGNWKKLIRGLLIRERLMKKYDLTEPELVDDKKEAVDDASSSQSQIRKNDNKKTTKSKKAEKKDNFKS